MRDANRLDDFYEKFKKIHKEYFTDLRFGQLCMNFLGWVQSSKGIDPFFPEENKMIELLKEYTKNNSTWYTGGVLFNDDAAKDSIKEGIEKYINDTINKTDNTGT